MGYSKDKIFFFFRLNLYCLNYVFLRNYTNKYDLGFSVVMQEVTLIMQSVAQYTA